MVFDSGIRRVTSRGLLARLAWVVLAWTGALVSVDSAHGAVDRAPRLELRGDWYAVVAPYRYVEARRFERGWNRGADVQVADGLVRSPVSGTIRFVGSIAGRRIVTITTRVDGEPAVVTLTGLDQIGALAPGARIVAGDAVGHGSRMHVGAYDPRRRSRYLPVLGVALAGAGVDGSDGDGGVPGARSRLVPGRSALADGIAGRLRDAIEGITAPGVRVLPAASITAVPTTVSHPPAGLDPGAAADAVVHARAARARTASWTRPVRVMTAVQRARARASAHGVGRSPLGASHGSVAGDGFVVAHGRTARRAVRVARPSSDRQRSPIAVSGAPAGGWVLAGPGGRDTLGSAAGRVSSPGPVSSGAQAWAPSEVGGSGRGVQRSVEAADLHAGPRPLDTARGARSAGSSALVDAWRVPCLLAAALACVVAVWRRRRGRAGESVPADPLAASLPVLLPQPVRIGPRVVRTDGSSVLPDIALAWPDADRGSSLETDPFERATTRHTEHA